MPLTFHDDLVMVLGKYFMRHITPLLRSTPPGCSNLDDWSGLDLFAPFI
jgi:hypothetical protein